MSGPSDFQRLIGDINRLGTIEAVDLDGPTCRVRIGDLVTGDIPWVALRAGGKILWSPPTIGEQCLLICPEADTAAGVALLGIYSTAHPAPSSSPDVDLARYPDGAETSYDSAEHVLRAILPEGARVEIVAPAGIVIDAPAGVRFKGSISVDDNVQVGTGATGSFTTPTGGVVTVQAGIITGIDG
jgi:phage baseplate assembly protein V